MLKRRTQGKNTLVHLPTDKLLTSGAQPRKSFDSESLAELCESIRQNGIVQPLTVRELENGQYMLISGERRLRAARLAGFSRVPCVILRAGEQNAAVFSLLDNIQHKPLDFFEEADAIYTLISQWGVPREDVASRLGISQSTLSNKLRLLRLTRWQRDRIQASNLSERHARALLKIEDDETRDNALLTVIAKGMNVMETELLAENSSAACHATAKPEKNPPAAPGYRRYPPDCQYDCQRRRIHAPFGCKCHL